MSQSVRESQDDRHATARPGRYCLRPARWRDDDRCADDCERHAASSAPALNITQTWNNLGVTFIGAMINVTDTQSASDSLLLDIRLSGVSKFTVRKDGLLVRLGGVNATIDSTVDLLSVIPTYDTSVVRYGL